MLLPWQAKLSHEIVLGMDNFFRGRHQCLFFHLFPNASDLKSVLSWRLDGIIAALHGEEMFSMAKTTRCPLISTHGGDPRPSIHQVDFNSETIAQMAAQHLLALGHRHFAFVGWAGENGPQIGRFFKKQIGAAGYPLHIFRSEVFARFGNFTEEFHTELAGWMNGLPRPTAILCRDDWWAVPVRMTCQKLKLSIPEEISVLGIGDDEIFCESIHPPLSSIRLPHRLAGFKIAQTLHRLIRSPSSPKREHILLPPEMVVERQSTSLFATRDPSILSALRFIKAEAANKITVQDVAQASGVSRRVLEQRFRAILGRGPHTEIKRQRIEKAKGLLASTDIGLELVAERSGFSSANYMGDAFSCELGVNPREYRRQRNPATA